MSTCSRGQRQFRHPGPAGAGDGQLGAVLLGEQADRGRLDPQRQVLGDDGDVVPLGLQVAGDREDPGVVVPQPVAGGQHAGVRVVELDTERAAEVPDRDGGVEPAVPDPELVEQPQGLPGEVAELRMVPLGLQLRDHDDRQHDLVLVEAGHGVGVGQQHAGVENVGAPVVAYGASCWSPRKDVPPRMRSGSDGVRAGPVRRAGPHGPEPALRARAVR